jgi:hypothetical protein
MYTAILEYYHGESFKIRTFYNVLPESNCNNGVVTLAYRVKPDDLSMNIFTIPIKNLIQLSLTKDN